MAAWGPSVALALERSLGYTQNLSYLLQSLQQAHDRYLPRATTIGSNDIDSDPTTVYSVSLWEEQMRQIAIRYDLIYQEPPSVQP
jgi:hypothetical protein